VTEDSTEGVAPSLQVDDVADAAETDHDNPAPSSATLATPAVALRPHEPLFTPETAPFRRRQITSVVPSLCQATDGHRACSGSIILNTNNQWGCGLVRQKRSNVQGQCEPAFVLPREGSERLAKMLPRGRVHYV
jgi:hypothetical protein